MSRGGFLPVLLVVGLAACSDASGPNPGGVKPPAQLTIIPLPAAAAAIWNPVDSFYAKKGTDRELRIYFTDPAGGPGHEYMRLRVDAPTLKNRPDGTPFQVGDSVLITVRVTDPRLIQFDFEPAGLTFDPVVPAELRIDYGETRGDLNDDGAVTAADTTIQNIMAVWRQELAGQPYLKVGGIKIEELSEIDVDLLGFTRYAIAY